jgi:hypothetical protein
MIIILLALLGVTMHVHVFVVVVIGSLFYSSAVRTNVLCDVCAQQQHEIQVLLCCMEYTMVHSRVSGGSFEHLI